MSDAVFISAISAIGSILTTLISGLIAIRLGRLHQQLNSRMDQLLSSEKASSRAEGVTAGQKDTAAAAAAAAAAAKPTHQSSRDFPVD